MSIFRSGLSLVLVLSFSAGAYAQANRRAPRRRTSRVSPYVNLLRSGNRGDNPALLYQGVIRPQITANRERANQQSDISRIRERQKLQERLVDQRYQDVQRQILEIRQLSGRKTVETGHPVQFMSTGGYFSGAPY